MKKKILAVISFILTCVITFGVTGCLGDGEQGGDPSEPKQYTVQYTDEGGTKQITVTANEPYSLAAIPEKTGYTFLGLYDAEEGGTQYVNASGSSVMPFKDGKSIILYPQYKAKEYTVILDYQGAPVTGDRQIKVDYGTELTELPQDLSLNHKSFTGWYTQENGKGVRVADQYGVLPRVSVVNETNFTLSKDGYIYLYAGFEAEKISVVCCFGDGMENETVEVEWNTPVSKIVTKTRNSDGEVPLTWSKKSDKSELFNGNLTVDSVIYAVEFAPVIEFDTDGGETLNAVVARAGSNISLPTPVKEGYKFVNWETADGREADFGTMPSGSISLKAVWQAKIVFDSNGGTSVSDISVAAGESIQLPVPEKEDFIFAGWYTADRELFTRSTMPSASTKLKAGWYREKTDNVVVIGSSASSSFKRNSASINSACYTVKFNDYFSEKQPRIIKIKAHLKIKSSWGEVYGSIDAACEVYSLNKVSSSNLIASYTFKSVGGDYREYDFDFTVNVSDDFYMCFYHKCKYDSWTFNISDFYYTIHYPDTANLYL